MPKDTRTHILDIAERHFAMNGFAGTTLRGIIKEAKVNVAAVAYHFGTKEDLYVEVMQRFAVPVVTQQLKTLQSFRNSAESLSLVDVVRSFYEPPVQLVKSLGKRGETLSLFLGRAQTEPEPVFSLVDKNYSSCRDEFIAAFKICVPNLKESDYQWRFEFMLSLIVCFLTRQKMIRDRYGDKDDWVPEEVVARLVEFCCHGFESKSF